MTTADEQVAKELRQIGGRFEWSTPLGVGVSVSRVTTEDLFQATPRLMSRLAWINLENSGATDRTLMGLESASRLESVRLVNTRVTLSGIERLLDKLPTLKEVVVSVDQFDPVDRDHVRKLGRVVFAEERADESGGYDRGG